MAVGYDDDQVPSNGVASPSLVIRNSCDFWTILKTDRLSMENQA